jgi:hypothetical protein
MQAGDVVRSLVHRVRRHFTKGSTRCSTIVWVQGGEYGSLTVHDNWLENEKPWCLHAFVRRWYVFVFAELQVVMVSYIVWSRPSEDRGFPLFMMPPSSSHLSPRRVLVGIKKSGNQTTMVGSFRALARWRPVMKLIAACLDAARKSLGNWACWW